MDDGTRWIKLDGAVDARDLGGLPTADGRTTRRARVLRSDGVQNLTVTDVRILLDDYGVKNVIDLRSDTEVRLEGPGPLSRLPSVTVHQSPLPEARPQEERSTGHYLGYLADCGPNIVTVLRIMTRTDGSALVHCAAGEDRTGVVCALALDVVGVTRDAILADHALSGERPEAVLHAGDTRHPHTGVLEELLARLDDEFGGTTGWLSAHGWTADDTDTLRTRLLS